MTPPERTYKRILRNLGGIGSGAGELRRANSPRRRIAHLNLWLVVCNSFAGTCASLRILRGMKSAGKREGATMRGSGLSVRDGLIAVLAVSMGLLCGCASKEEKALEQAKQQAAKTGQAQQVVTV